MLFSYSRLNKFQACPWSWYQKYILDQEEPPTELLVMGKVVHKAIDLRVKGASASDALLQAILEEATVVINFKEARDMVEAGVRYLSTVFGDGGGTETHFQLPLDAGDAFSPEIQGYIDWMNQEGPTILDWKTGFKVYQPTGNYQLPLYAWAIAQQHEVDQVNGSLIFLRQGKVKSHQFTLQEMEAARQWAYDLATDIETRLLELEMGGNPQELFPAQPGGACAYCGCARDCEENGYSSTGEQPLSQGMPKTYEQAAALAAKILRLEAAEKEMKQALKGWVQKQGPVLVQDQQWDLWPSMSWQFGPDQLKNMARAVAERGENPWQFFGLSSADLNKLQEKIGWTDKDLKTMGGKEKVTKSFRAKKVEKKKEEQAASA